MNQNGLHVLVFLASILFLVAVYFSFKLSKETKHEKYWLTLAVGFLIFAVHHWMMIPWSFGAITESSKYTIEQISSIIGASLMTYSTYGLYISMKKVNEKIK